MDQPGNANRRKRRASATKDNDERTPLSAAMQAMLNDPKIQQELKAAEISCPPWEAEGWSPPPPSNHPPGELLRLMRERLGSPRVNAYFLKVTPDKGSLASMKKLKAARKKNQELGAVVRDEAFDDWISRYVVSATIPSEWTQARVLYESYLRQARNYGLNRADKRLSKEELATETQWGRMMGHLYPNKKRRRHGWYYPLRLKQGA